MVIMDCPLGVSGNLTVVTRKWGNHMMHKNLEAHGASELVKHSEIS